MLHNSNINRRFNYFCFVELLVFSKLFSIILFSFTLLEIFNVNTIEKYIMTILLYYYKNKICFEIFVGKFIDCKN